MQRILLFLGFMAVGTASIILITMSDPPPREPVTIDLPLKVLIMRQVVIRQHEEQGMTMELKAERAMANESTKKVSLKKVTFRMFDPEKEKGKEVMRGKAESALVDQRKGTITLEGKVELKDSDGVEMHTEKLAYEKKPNLITAPGKISIVKAGALHRGQGMVYRLGPRTMTLGQPEIFR